MGNKKLTIKHVQNRQRALVDHFAPLKLYNIPWVKIGELVPQMWQLETIHGQHGKAPETIKAMVAACLLHLVDYCNAKGYDLAELIEENLTKLEQMRREEDEKAGQAN